MRSFWIALFGIVPIVGLTEPIGAGNAELRHDLTMLTDEGVLTAPIVGWPLSSGDLAELADSTDLPPHLSAARRRVVEALGNRKRLFAEVGALSRDFVSRGFQRVTREDAEATLGVDWRSDRYTARLRLSRASNPMDNREWRADGSVLGMRLGNWWVGASLTDRWWGPGWDGSLILSNNARPVPALVLQRHRSEPFASRWLRWIGPWTTQLIWGQLEDNRAVGNARLFAWRAGFRPLPKLEIGASRTAQWCGSGRPCSGSTFLDLFSGVRDNRGENTDIESEPGNQLGGFDLRYSFSLLSRPMALYAQRIGEDERDGRPSANLAQLGLSTWGANAAGDTFRWHIEYADTACGAITGDNPILGCAYNHSIYQSGYRYRGAAIAHAQDGDGRIWSSGLHITQSNGDVWRFNVRGGELNRSNRSLNTAAAINTDIIDFEVSYKRRLRFGELIVGAGAEELSVGDASGTWYGRGHLSLSIDF